MSQLINSKLLFQNFIENKFQFNEFIWIKKMKFKLTKLISKLKFKILDLKSRN